jgi:predicted dehydrogenase
MSDTPSTIPNSLSNYMDRRNFVRTSVYTGAGVYLATSKTATAQATADGKLLKVGIVGCGDQASRIIGACKDIPGIQYVACADIWPLNRIGKSRLIKSYWGSCNEYSELSEMLAKEKDLDCVVVASPDFLHAPMTREALQAGKSVYCEKMMTNTIDAAKDMVKAQRETGGLLQIGHQRHSNPRYLNLRDNILNKEQLLGRVTHCYGQWNRGIAQSVPKEFKNSSASIPADVLSRYGYGSMEEFLNWRFFAKYGGGPISDLGAHQIDMFNWFFNTQPVSVMATGGVDYYDGTPDASGKPKAKFELPDNVMAMFEYKLPSGTMRAYYQVLTTTGSQGYFEKLMGTDGTAVISESGANQIYRELSSPKSWDSYAQGDKPIINRTAASTYHKFWEKPKPWTRAETWLDVKQAAGASKAPEQWELGATLDKYPHTPHLENFFEAARKKDHKMLNCPVDQAYRSCVTVLRCYDSIKSGTKYTYTPEDFNV